jgi:hypothetical protein
MSTPERTEDDAVRDEHTSRVRAQAALVRALLDEIARYASSDPRALALREQLAEESARLDSLSGTNN